MTYLTTQVYSEENPSRTNLKRRDFLLEINARHAFSCNARDCLRRWMNKRPYKDNCMCTANTSKQRFHWFTHIYCLRSSQCFLYSSTMQPSDPSNGIEERLRQRASAQQHPLQTIPDDPAVRQGHLIPNTPLAVSTISFVLGSVFSLGALLFLSGGIQNVWWATPQLGFFVAAWSAFHWGEFAATAGWNLTKCSVDCTSFVWV